VNHLIAKHAAGPVFGASPCSWSPRARCASTAFQELLGEVDGIVAVKPERDKAARMSVALAKFESGLVFLPELPRGSLISRPSSLRSRAADTTIKAIQSAKPCSRIIGLSQWSSRPKLSPARGNPGHGPSWMAATTGQPGHRGKEVRHGLQGSRNARCVVPE
jgi:hypothetical protein